MPSHGHVYICLDRSHPVGMMKEQVFLLYLDIQSLLGESFADCLQDGGILISRIGRESLSPAYSNDCFHASIIFSASAF